MPFIARSFLRKPLPDDRIWLQNTGHKTVRRLLIDRKIPAAQRGDICENAVIESALVIPSKMTAALLPSSLKMSYGLIQKEWFARKQFAALRIPEEFFEDYFRDTKELSDIMKDLYLGEKITVHNEPMTVSYDEILGREFKLIEPSSKYKWNEEYEIYEDMSDDDDYMRDVYENAEPLKITAIIYKPQEKGSGSSSTTGVLYLPELTSYVMNKAYSSEIVLAQLKDPDYDVFSGKAFDDEDDDEALNFEDMITVDEDLLAEAFVINMDLDGLSMDPNAMTDIIMNSSKEVVDSIDEITGSMVKAVTQADSAFANGIIEGYKQMATVTLTESTAPEAAPDVSGAVSTLESLKETIETTAREEAKKVVNERIDKTISDLEGVTTVAEAEAYIDSLGLNEEMTAQLKDMIRQSSSGSESGDAEAPVDVSELISGLQSMKETIADLAANSAASQATEGIQKTIDSLQSASTKAEADAVIDGMDTSGMDGENAGLIKSALKSQIKKQYEDGGETTEKKYITLDYLEIYKENAISEDKVAQMLGSIEQIKLDPALTTRIIEESFDNYYGSLSPNENNMVPVSDLPSTDEAIGQAMKDNSSALFEEGYNLAKEYMALLVAKGTGEALAEALAPLSNMFSGDGDFMTFDTDKFAEAFKFNKDEDEISRLMETMVSGKERSYKGNLLNLGYQREDDPTSISFYFDDFESKNHFTDFLTRYNENADEAKKLQYTDITGILMGSVETIVNAVTYVLIAFVSISLVVSSIMIGIITYISVLERTKEIGILRAIGASKRNISSIFNAETCIIGLLSGIIGVIVTRLLLFPINDIIHKVTEIDDITAVLEPQAAVALVIIATVLTMIGGLIPSRSASKKDPVIALRTE